MKLFHVHTFRCGHAEDVSDEEYVKKAVELGADEIWFTDHAPFPDDPFGSRMKLSDLDEYLSTLSSLKNKYKNIDIHIGLETEYFPSFHKNGYYDKLRSMKGIELLLLGQHMAEISETPPAYSFSESKEYLDKNEYRLLGNAIVQGIRTGYYNAVAHPDRIFRRISSWTSDMEAISMDIINAAMEADIPLETNMSFIDYPMSVREEFWQLVPKNAKIIKGLDAHYLNEMITRSGKDFVLAK